LFGRPIEAPTLDIVLPVGISFYTFQTLSYTIDVYRRRIRTMRDPPAVFAFVSFSPQPVAGPIERAGDPLPQFRRKRSFDYQKATDGLRQILWGLIKKMVIAQKCAPHVDAIFANYTDYSGSTPLLGAFLFSLQI
jgi:D-alanyl-lipoteichoic acid acyltransferase DltB (MBOAT superfamily)